MGGFFSFRQEPFFLHCRENLLVTMARAITTSGTIAMPSLGTSCRSKYGITRWATQRMVGRSRVQSFGTVGFRSPCLAQLTQPTEMGLFKVRDRNLQVSCQAYRFTSSTRFPVSLSRALFSGSTPKPSSQPWTQAQGSAMAETGHKLVSLEHYP